jgi:hypothetical protein
VHEVAGMILDVGGGAVLRYPYTYEEYLYHIAQKNDGDTGIVKKPTSTAVVAEESGASKAERYEQIKKLKRERTRIEEELKVLEDEKDRLLRYFEKYPTAYAPDKQKELAIVTDVIEEKDEGDYFSAVQILEQMGYGKKDITHNRRIDIGRVLNKYKCYQNTHLRKWKLKIKQDNRRAE